MAKYIVASFGWGNALFSPKHKHGQGQLPMYLDDRVPEEDLARVVHEVVERLNISKIIGTIKKRKMKSLYRGGDAYHHRLHLKILFYGYRTGAFSSRKLAAQTLDKHTLGDAEKRSKPVAPLRRCQGNEGRRRTRGGV